MSLSRIKEAEQLEKAVPIMKRLIEEHEGFIPYDKLRILVARELKVSVSYMPYYINYATLAAKAIVHDWRSGYVYLPGTDLKALVKAVKDDPWKGHPNHDWRLDGYLVDDAISDTIMELNRGRDPEKALDDLLDRIRTRKLDWKRK